MSKIGDENLEMNESHREALELCQQKRYAEALPLFALAVAEDPDNPELQYHYGSCLYCSGRVEEARDRWSRAHRLSPKNQRYLRWLRKAEAEAGPAEPAVLPPDSGIPEQTATWGEETPAPPPAASDSFDFDDDDSWRDSLRGATETEPRSNTALPDISLRPGEPTMKKARDGYVPSFMYTGETDSSSSTGGDPDWLGDDLGLGTNSDSSGLDDDDFSIKKQPREPETRKARSSRSSIKDTGQNTLLLPLLIAGGIVLAVIFGLVVHLLHRIPMIRIFKPPFLFHAIMGAGMGGYIGYIRQGKPEALKRLLDASLIPLAIAASLSFLFFDYLGFGNEMTLMERRLKENNAGNRWGEETSEPSGIPGLDREYTDEELDKGEQGIAGGSNPFIGFWIRVQEEKRIAGSLEAFLKKRTGQTGFPGYFIFRMQMGWQFLCGVIWIRGPFYLLLMVLEYVLAVVVARKSLDQEKVREARELERAARRR